MSSVDVMIVLGYVVLAAPTVLLAVLGLASLLGVDLPERTISRVTQACMVTGLLAVLVILGVMLGTGERQVLVPLGHWVVMPQYHFKVQVVFDRLSVPLVILSFALCGTVGAFANRYVHRERGYSRFFLLYALFVVGMVVTCVAGTIETLFFGWELVGLSSALLVAFFQERPAPATNGLRVWIVYRISDAALLLAAVVMHHLSGEGDFLQVLGRAPWPEGETSLSASQALIVGLLIVIAAAGKSALVPFSGWLPRAMEGPTPSSAVFYGALSVHLGAFLLLRMDPLLEASPWLYSSVVVLGLTTALLAYVAGSVQTDIKSALSFAALSQVGLIFAEIGLGWKYFALVHLIGHACLRTLQFIRAPTLLQDYRGLENAIGARLSRPAWLGVNLLPRGQGGWLYRLGLERGYLDTWLDDYVAGPFVRAFRWFDRVERRWAAFLGGPVSPAPERVEFRP
ncbi:MAG: proton-conducting transporter membrane subunit [Gemmataceae bacterium]